MLHDIIEVSVVRCCMILLNCSKVLHDIFGSKVLHDITEVSVVRCCMILLKCL